jgi:hypothetical protein
LNRLELMRRPHTGQHLSSDLSIVTVFISLQAVLRVRDPMLF